jgi:glycine betaine/proline transport system permease protein
MLGISQTVLLAFGMLVITALVGTRGLEQETLVALSRAKVGDGLVAGFGISFLSIIADRLIVHGSARLRRRLGQP